MHPLDNFYKLRCATLEEQRLKLIQQLKLLDEQISISPGMSAQDPAYQVGEEPVVRTKKKLPRRRKSETEVTAEEEQGMRPPMEQDPLDPRAQHGLEPYGLGEYGLRDILQRYSDNPETAEVEVPQQATWQATNTAIGNYMRGEVDRLKRMHGMV
jgi:hypothetical protein